MEEVIAEYGDAFREIKLAVKYKCKLDERVCAAAASQNDVLIKVSARERLPLGR
jgi:hypothetical protein